MAVVVEQTIPFPPSSLDIDNPSRWNTLLPLIRPSVKAVLTPKGQSILINDALAKSKYLRVAVVTGASNFSSKLLDELNVTAIITDQAGAGLLTVQDIQHAIHSSGVARDQGLVVVRRGKRQRVELHSSDVLEVETESELQLDHIVHLLGYATESCRTSIHHTVEMLKGFVKTVNMTSSSFHTEKDAEGNPMVLQDSEAEPMGFQNAREVVERELKLVLPQVHKAQTAETKDVVYSVHFADVNGLSRLEVYILAGEIARYLQSENVPYTLSHSTIRDAQDPGRGWALCISPISSYYLSAQAQPQPHHHQQDPEHEDQPITRTDSKLPTDHDQTTTPSKPHLALPSNTLHHRIKSACLALIAAEPRITEYDTIVGDGDCGITLRDGAQKCLSYIQDHEQDKNLSNLPFPETLLHLVRELEISMGGTSGALYCIYLTALATALSEERRSVPDALHAALESSYAYTPARVGDRTMMDVLIPFVETLVASDSEGDGERVVQRALEAATQGVESTKTMRATLGRSAYLDDGAIQGVPDPGAYGLYVLLKGFCDG